MGFVKCAEKKPEHNEISGASHWNPSTLASHPYIKPRALYAYIHLSSTCTLKVSRTVKSNIACGSRLIYCDAVLMKRVLAHTIRCDHVLNAVLAGRWELKSLVRIHSNLDQNQYLELYIFIYIHFCTEICVNRCPLPPPPLPPNIHIQK